MPVSQTDRPKGAPDGAESLPGVIEAYAAYEETKVAAKKKDATAEDLATFDAACIELHKLRKLWREIKQYAQAAALAEWEASQEGKK